MHTPGTEQFFLFSFDSSSFKQECRDERKDLEERFESWV